ncbi:MAG: DAK2 domain-containing protein [Chloroflexota bacterium]
MTGDSTYNGQDLKQMFAAGSDWLDKNVSQINAINVFPVPDGDTGTNMHLTMQSSLEEAERVEGTSASVVMKALSDGALIGARGNSGVILSQIMRGMSRSLGDKDTFTSLDFAQALCQASDIAYKSLTKPVEGTMLTVIRDMSQAARRFADSNLTSLLHKTVLAARDSVARTPLLLPVLRQAGVVDAGAQGLYVLFEGALGYLEGDTEMLLAKRPQVVAASVALTARALPGKANGKFGYCTEFLLRCDKLNMPSLRRHLQRRGDSLVIAGDEGAVHVHIHSPNPGAVLSYVTDLGTVHQIKIQNMDDQHVDFLAMQQERLPLGIGVVAVAPGDGLKDVLESLGAAVVPGGQTMNPSVKEILRAVAANPCSQIIILPNNRNIILAAEQVKQLTAKETVVVPTETVPQGIAALLSFNPEEDVSQNVTTMTQALKAVRTIEVTRAARKTQLDGIEVKRGQFIALLDGENLVAAGDNADAALFAAVDKADARQASVLTIYYGANTTVDQAEEAAQEFRNRYPHLQAVDVVFGGHPHYNYVVSIE